MMTEVIGGRYAVEAQIGAGGMGEVYRGIDTQTGRAVAIKNLISAMAHPDMIERFRREGEALRALNHPNIVMLFDALEENGGYYLIMEYVPGGDLTQLMSHGRLSTEQILHLAIDLADALTRAHKLNITHRDLKPANILIGDDGTLKLSDFGVAYFADKRRVTGMDGIVGTIDYLAPEVLKGESPDARVDIWAFGVMLYEMLAGKRPFTGKTVGEIITAILMRATPDLEAECPDAPLSLIDLIYRMLERDRNARIASVRLVGAELEAILQGRNGKSSRDHAAHDPTVIVQAARFKLDTPPALNRSMHNLPAQTTPFIGREAELQELSRLLRDRNNRLITIHAPGGMGKTRLSLECGEQNLHAFEHGVYLVQLAPLSDPSGIIPAIAEATGYPFQQDDRDQKQQILDYLADKHMLLILDNYEHLISSANLVTDLLQGARNIHILVTSRQRLNLSGETVFNLGAMDFPDWETPADALDYAAVKLFLQSAKRIRPDFELTVKDLPFIARICRLAHGTPLGILLAASWLSTLSPEEIAGEMQKSLDFLESDLRDLPQRQRSLRAVFDYSWDLLDETEQTVFMKLSLFRGGFTREAAGEIAGASLRTLMSLINKSLLHRDVETGRYDVHELLRQFAEERLDSSGEVEATRERYSHYYMAFVKEREIDIKGRAQLAGLNALEADFENVQAVWGHALKQKDGDTIDAMIEGVYWFCLFRTRFQTGADLFQRARSVWTQDSIENSLLSIKLHLRFPTAVDKKAQFERAIAASRQLNAPSETAFGLRALGLQLSHVEVDPAGITLLHESLALYEAVKDSFYAATVLDELGWAYFLAGYHDEREEVVRRSKDIREAIGDRIGTANALRNLSTSTWLLRFDETAVWLSQAHAIGLEMKDRTGTAWTAMLLASQMIWKGRFGEAAALIDEGQRVAEDMNFAPLKGLTYVMRAWLLGMRGEYEQGMQWAEKGVALLDAEESDPAILSFSAYGVAANAVGLGNYDRITEQFASLQSMTTVMRSRDSTFSENWIAELVTYIPIYVGYLAGKGRFEEAVVRLSAAVNHPRWMVNWETTWSWLVDLQMEARAHLGDAAYEAAWESGKMFDIEVVVNEMLAIA